MIEPKIDDLLAQVDSKYSLVILAAKRAREINSYYSQLGEGRADRGEIWRLPNGRAGDAFEQGPNRTIKGRIHVVSLRQTQGGCPVASSARYLGPWHDPAACQTNRTQQETR